VAGGLKWKFLGATGQFTEAFHAVTEPIAVAGTAAMDDIAAEIKQRGRADIVAGGLGGKWANALRVLRFPKRGIALTAAVFAFHKIGYADVFEKGMRIAGRPLLWIPLATTARKFGGKRLTPSLIASRFGDLISINRPGHPPLLAAKVAGRISARTQQFGGGSINRASKAGARNVTLQPLFVGVPSVKESQRTHLIKVFETAAKSLATRFASHFKGE
jgi:hypothetical protein